MTPERPLPPAADYGWLADLRTPCYVYEPEVAIARYRSLKARLGASVGPRDASAAGGERDIP